MSQNRPQDQITYKILDILWNAACMLPEPMEAPSHWSSRLYYFDPQARSSYFAFRRLKKRGLIKITHSRSKKFIELTQKGKLEILFKKGSLPGHVKWDGKWRVIIFDGSCIGNFC